VKAEPEVWTPIGVDMIFVFDDYLVAEANPAWLVEDDQCPMPDVTIAKDRYLLGLIEVEGFDTDHSEIAFVSAAFSHSVSISYPGRNVKGFLASPGKFVLKSAEAYVIIQ
jgi:hypothetical protein